MAPTIVLDTSPLSTVTKRKGVAEADACRHWVKSCRLAGHIILAPSIAYYEVARELERAGNVTGLFRLNAFCSIPGCYLPLTDSALKLAVSLLVFKGLGPTALKLQLSDHKRSLIATC